MKAFATKFLLPLYYRPSGRLSKQQSGSTSNTYGLIHFAYCSPGRVALKIGPSKPWPCEQCTQMACSIYLRLELVALKMAASLRGIRNLSSPAKFSGMNLVTGVCADFKSSTPASASNACPRRHSQNGPGCCKNDFWRHVRSISPLNSCSGSALNCLSLARHSHLAFHAICLNLVYRLSTPWHRRGGCQHLKAQAQICGKGFFEIIRSAN